MQVGHLFRKATYSWLLLGMFIGLFLRWVFVSPVPGVNYKYLLHTHSHLVLLGWVYGGLYLLTVDAFVPPAGQRRFNSLFFWVQVSLIGMLLSFPVQGYGAVSIAFSTLFVVTTYVFTAWILRVVQRDDRPAIWFLRHALVFLVISSLGPYVLGYLMVKGLEGSPWYDNAIYFYLHFLYNGFFVWTLGSWVLNLLEKQGTALSVSRIEVFGLALATWLTFGLSVLWMKPSVVWYAAGLVGALVQLSIISAWVLFKSEGKNAWKRLAGGARGVGAFVVLILILKLLLQFVSAFPGVSDWIYATRMFTVIGYIHLVMLGIFTPFLAITLTPGLVAAPMFKGGAWMYVVGFVWTEFLLFGNGLWPILGAKLPVYPLLLAGYLLIGISIVWIGWYVMRSR